MKDARDISHLREKLSAFFLNPEFTIEPIPGGASSRKYYKIRFQKKSYFPAPTVLLMLIPKEEPAVLSDYMNIDYYFKRVGVPAPRLYEINEAEGWIFLEYQQSPTLENYLRKHPEKVGKVLPEVVNFLLDFQKKCIFEEHCPAFQRRFDYEKYRYEFDSLVQEQLLKLYYQREYDRKAIQNLAHEVSSYLDISLPVFVHRDFQCNNIFYDEHDAETPFRIIDFQDARHGTPIYDLVSCLWDSYVPIAEDLRNKLLKEYFSRLPEFSINWDWEEYEKMVDYTVIQRKLHDAGAFAFNYQRFNNQKYVEYIRSAVAMALERMREHPQFSNASEIFEALLIID